VREVAFLNLTLAQSESRSLLYVDFAVAFRASLFFCESAAQKAWRPERRLFWVTYEDVDCATSAVTGSAELASHGTASTASASWGATGGTGDDGYRALE
jgi:hypothetical protein